MVDEAQAQAYASADFSAPHDMFIRYYKDIFTAPEAGSHILDLGCGTADISIRFAQAFPDCQVHAVDGASQMLAYGKRAISAARLNKRIQLIQGYLPDDVTLPHSDYPVIISNSLLHHLHQADVLWQSIRRFAQPTCAVFIMDLMRPESAERAQELVDLHATGEAHILRRDFYNSLCAAFLPQEIQQQLSAAGLEQLQIKIISDRHLLIYGRI